MEIKDMTIEQVEERLAAIQSEITAEDADLDALETEIVALEERKKEINALIEKRAALEARVMATGTEVKDFVQKEEPKMEVRNSVEYINAYANYIKNEDDTECRALLTEEVDGGYVPVPDIVENTIKTAWDREGIMSRVKKSYLKGNIRIGFELSATGAVVHTEGAAAPSEEVLTLGIVELVPKSIKKWITISDEAMDLTGSAFLEYIYSEVAYQIAKKAASELIGKIVAAGTESAATSIGVPVMTATQITQALVAEGLGQLSDEAENPIIVMNRQTEAAFKGVQYAGNYATDIFEGCAREYTSALKSFSAATTGECWAIIGDFASGAQANFPAGEEITFKFDDLSLAEKDLVKIVGREFVALGLVAPGRFVKIIK